MSQAPFNNTQTWVRSALTGRTKVFSSNFAAGQYVSRNLGSQNNFITCDTYEDALKVRIAPADETISLQALNANAAGGTWLALAKSTADKEFGKNSSEWAALTVTTFPCVTPLHIAATNTQGPVSWSFYLGYDGTLRNVWKDDVNDVGYQLSWSVELKSRRVYGVSSPKAYVNRYYSSGNTEQAVRLVFEPDPTIN